MTITLTPLPWTADMSVGVEAIDAEHQTLVILYNDLLRALKQPVSATMRKAFYDTLWNHLHHHLAHEEAILAARGHPDVAAHIAGHRQAKAALSALAAPADGPVDLAALAHFLRDWIVVHILEEDRAAFAQPA